MSGTIGNDEIYVCVDMLDAEITYTPSSTVVFSILVFINVAVIVGNMLVIVAVALTPKLQTVTNSFVVSLAVSDLLVGMLVLPFSAIWEVYKVWIFGEFWCSTWLAVDIWMCTASILNLCVISLDRFVAISRPMTYPAIMTWNRARFLISLVWILSFMICFPPLVGWRDTKLQYDPTKEYIAINVTSLLDGSSNTTLYENNITEIISSTANMSMDAIRNLYPQDISRIILEARINNWDPERTQLTLKKYFLLTALLRWRLGDIRLLLLKGGQRYLCPNMCQITNDKVYVLYSSIGSFFLPMTVMLSLYHGIYASAARTTTSYQRGHLTTKGGKDGEMITLRIHRGGRAPTRGRGRGGTRAPRSRSQEPFRTRPDSPESGVPASGVQTTSFTDEPIPSTSDGRTGSGITRAEIERGYDSDTSSDRSVSGKYCFDTVFRQKQVSFRDDYYADQEDDVTEEPSSFTRVEEPDIYPETGSEDETTTRFENDAERGVGSKTSDASRKGGFMSLTRKLAKGDFRKHFEELEVEPKAAKTLGIIVGAFTICWTPFFTVYVFRSFCFECVDPMCFSLLFWLGYCNSLVNPCIYALCSKEFREAFKEIANRIYKKKLPDDLARMRKRERDDKGLRARLRKLFKRKQNTEERNE